MADKILNTRIQLKYDTLANWKAKNTLLKQGEVAFVQIGEISVDDKGNRVIPPVMFKVGPGNFNDLGWSAATAADVYGWAKQETLPVVRNDADGQTEGNVISSISWDAVNNRVVYTTASVATSEGMAGLQEALDGLTNTINGMYTNEQINKAITDAVAALSAEGGAIKTVADDLAAHKQAFGEFQTANTQAIADAVAAEAEIARAAEKANSDAIDAIEADYLKAADLNDYAKTADVVTNDEFTAFEGTNTAAIADAKKAGTDAQTTANEALDKIDTFLESEEVDATVNTLKEIQTELDKLADATEMVEALSKKVDKETYEADLATQDSRDDGQDAKIQALEKKPGLDKVGTVTKVTAGEGLDGGDITVEGTISLNAATKASLALADTAVQPTAIANFASKTEVATAKQEAIDAAKTAGDLAYDSKGSAGDALNSAKAYTDELANGTVKTNSDKIAALEALDYILNGDTVILDCGGAE